MNVRVLGRARMGHFLDVTYEVEGIEDCIGLQVVQVVYGIPDPGTVALLVDDDPLGRLVQGVPVGDRNGIGFVDPLGEGTERVDGKPYYYTESQLQPNGQARYVFRPEGGSGRIRIYDCTNAAQGYDEVYFETAIVARRDQDRPDRVVHVLRWGWADHGLTFRPSPGGASEVYEPLPDPANEVSQTFIDIVGRRYLDYKTEPS